jgi:hypothetical protein
VLLCKCGQELELAAVSEAGFKELPAPQQELLVAGFAARLAVQQGLQPLTGEQVGQDGWLLSWGSLLPWGSPVALLASHWH